MTEPYDPNNIFAKILRGEAPCVRVAEDEFSLSFMDIMPRADGHVLVVPKTPARNILDIASSDLARLIPAVQRIAIAVKSGLGAEGIVVQQFNESPGGQIVFHLHFHVLPRWSGVALRPPGGPIAPPEQLEVHAVKIRAALAAG
jgi:histidine triad (HIT) family protein